MDAINQVNVLLKVTCGFFMEMAIEDGGDLAQVDRSLHLSHSKIDKIILILFFFVLCNCRVRQLWMLRLTLDVVIFGYHTGLAKLLVALILKAVIFSLIKIFAIKMIFPMWLWLHTLH